MNSNSTKIGTHCIHVGGVVEAFVMSSLVMLDVVKCSVCNYGNSVTLFLEICLVFSMQVSEWGSIKMVNK